MACGLILSSPFFWGGSCWDQRSRLLLPKPGSPAAAAHVQVLPNTPVPGATSTVQSQHKVQPQNPHGGLLLTFIRAGPLVEHICWDLEAEAQHLLVGRHVPDRESGAASSQGGSQRSLRPLLHVSGWVAVFGEAVAVHSGKGSRTAGLPHQEMPENIQKLHSQSWQIHHYVESGFVFSFQERELFAELLPHRPPQEVPAVHVEHLDLAVHFVELAVVQEPAVGLGVEVVGEHPALPLGCRDGEGPHPSEDVEQDIAGLEQLHDAAVLRGQARVPVHFGKVQFIGDVIFFDLQVQNICLSFCVQTPGRFKRYY